MQETLFLKIQLKLSESSSKNFPFENFDYIIPGLVIRHKSYVKKLARYCGARMHTAQRILGGKSTIHFRRTVPPPPNYRASSFVAPFYHHRCTFATQNMSCICIPKRRNNSLTFRPYYQSRYYMNCVMQKASKRQSTDSGYIPSCLFSQSYVKAVQAPFYHCSWEAFPGTERNVELKRTDN